MRKQTPVVTTYDSFDAEHRVLKPQLYVPMPELRSVPQPFLARALHAVADVVVIMPLAVLLMGFARFWVWLSDSSKRRIDPVAGMHPIAQFGEQSNGASPKITP